MSSNILFSNSPILIYDSECIFCSNFVKYLDLICDKNFICTNPLLIIDPSKISTLKNNNDLIIDAYEIEKLKKLSQSTIILIDNNNILIRTKALIRLCVFLRPKSKFLKFVNNHLSFLIGFILDPAYKLFAKYRYSISKILKKIFPGNFLNLNSSCFNSSSYIKFP